MTIHHRVARGFVLLMLLVACTGLVTSARADDTADYARPGPYLGLGAVYAPSFFDLEDQERAVGRSLSNTHAWGLDARAGYRVLRHLAGEFAFQYLNGFDLEGNDVDLGGIDMWSIGANGKVFAMTDRLQPYFIGGVGILHADADQDASGIRGSSTQFMGRVGVGADYYYDEHVVVNLEFSPVFPGSQLADFRYAPLTFGAQYRF